jgi:hypothetical protein
VSISKVTRAGAVGLALAGIGLVVAAGTATAATPNGDIPGADATGTQTADGDLTPGGVPIRGTVKSATGATKVLPGGQQGPGY